MANQYTKAAVADREPIPEIPDDIRLPIPGLSNDPAQQFLAQRQDINIKRVSYTAKEIPEDLAAALDGLAQSVTTTATDGEPFTVYDEFGLPSQCPSDKLVGILQEKNPKTGKPFFYARRPTGIPELLVAVCPQCGKQMHESPYNVGAGRVLTEPQKDWRVKVMIYRHMSAREPSYIPMFFPDRDERADLEKFARA